MIPIHNRVERETSVKDPRTQHPIIVQLAPPGDKIGFRRKHERTVHYLDILDMFKFVTRQWTQDIEGELAKVPEKPPVMTTGEHIVDLLMNHGRMHFSQIRKALKNKGMNLSKVALGAELVHLSRTNQIVSEPHGFYK